MAIMMAIASIMRSGGVVVPEAPYSIRHAFLEAHPSATQPIYRFSSDDAGPLFEIEFEESGTRQLAEYRYTNHDWLLDEHDTLAVDREEASFGTNQGEKPLALNRF